MADQKENAHPLVEQLLQPEAYPSPPDEPVTMLQTHISLLFFAGRRVYKIKKPVDMGFLDYRTLEARQHFCHEEVRLNRRLSPQMYLGVRAVLRDAAGRVRIGDGPAEGETIVDYAVEMIRLPSQRMLSALLERGEIDNAMIDTVVAKLVAFHRQCPTGPGVDEHASPQALAQQVHDTLTALQPQVPSAISSTLHAALQQWCSDFFAQHESLLQQRMAEGRVREGHGDLHSENICIVDDDIVIYDCIEFSPRFRCRDVACELAFLAMDMDRRGHRGFAGYLVRQYAQQAGDAQMQTLLPFYKLYLALVRAMVTAVKAAGGGLSDQERGSSLSAARAYALLAGSYAIGPALVITCGLPGSGKSWAAAAAAEPFEAHVLRSDVIRKNLLGIDATQRALEADAAAYSAQMSQRTYARMHELADQSLQQGRTVVADATFSSRTARREFITLARKFGVPWAVVHTHAPEEEIQRRMQARRSDQHEVSDADFAVYQQARARWEPPDEIAQSNLVRIGPASSRHAVAAAVIDALVAQRETNCPPMQQRAREQH